MGQWILGTLLNAAAGGVQGTIASGPASRPRPSPARPAFPQGQSGPASTASSGPPPQPGRSAAAERSAAGRPRGAALPSGSLPDRPPPPARTCRRPPTTAPGGGRFSARRGADSGCRPGVSTPRRACRRWDLWPRPTNGGHDNTARTVHPGLPACAARPPAVRPRRASPTRRLVPPAAAPIPGCPALFRGTSATARGPDRGGFRSMRVARVRRRAGRISSGSVSRPLANTFRASSYRLRPASSLACNRQAAPACPFIPVSCFTTRSASAGWSSRS